VVDVEERAKVRMRVLGGVTVAWQLAAAIVLVVGSALVGRVGGDSAHAGNSLVRTVQDSTVVCTVPELHGRSDFHIHYTRNFTGLSTPPASLDVLHGKTGLAWILSATFQNQQKGVSSSIKSDVATRTPLYL
jgi:hypothetical protein